MELLGTLTDGQLVNQLKILGMMIMQLSMLDRNLLTPKYLVFGRTQTEQMI